VGPKVRKLDRNNLASAHVLICVTCHLPRTRAVLIGHLYGWRTRLALYGYSTVMLTAEQINSIHRLHWPSTGRAQDCRSSLARRTISQYLVTPERSAARRQRASNWIRSSPPLPMAEQDPNASAVVVAQRLGPLGFTGGLST